MYLGKYPLFVSSGTPISTERAYEILLQTIDFSQLDNNPRRYHESNLILERLNLPTIQKAHDYVDFNVIAEFNKSIGNIASELYYLRNYRLTSAYLNGPFGWLNWEGSLENSFSLSKHAEFDSLIAEINLIATTFPDLTVTFKLLPDNYESESTKYTYLEAKVADGLVSLAEASELKADTDLYTNASKLSYELTDVMLDRLKSDYTPREWDLHRLYETYINLRNKNG